MARIFLKHQKDVPISDLKSEINVPYNKTYESMLFLESLVKS